MPGFRPVFLVTKVGDAKRKSPANRYTGNEDSEEMYRVGLIHGFFAGVGMDLFFETEQQASLFSLWTLYNPGQMIEALEGEPYGVEWIQKLKFYGQTNQYTGKATVSDSWTVGMKSRRQDKALNLRFPAERDARRFTEGKEYTGQDLFGTLPAMPADVEERLRADYDALIQAEADRAAQQAIADASQQAQVTEVVSAWEAANPPPGPPIVPRTYFYQSVSSALGDFARPYYWVTSGGASGWYRLGSIWENVPGVQNVFYTATVLQSIGFIHHGSGTFTTPFNGPFQGDFESDASLAAGVIVASDLGP